jgi:hypothetical protein
MKRTFLPFLCILVLGVAGAQAWGDDVETIVFLRHGEKPTDTEIGQIKTAGLNRALALPDVLLVRYKDPKFIFAPGTSDKVMNTTTGQQYAYLRPLITIEPTAIRAGLPVNTDFGYRHYDDLEAELLKEQYKGAMIYVSWEHHMLVALVKKLIVDLHGQATVPEWPKDDFDSLFVVTIRSGAAGKTIDLQVDHEGIKPTDVFPSPGSK